MEPVAFGPLGLTPQQFRRMTPAEFYAMDAGYMARLTGPDGLPWLVSWLLRLTGSELPWTPHRVLGLKETR